MFRYYWKLLTEDGLLKDIGCRWDNYHNMFDLNGYETEEEALYDYKREFSLEIENNEPCPEFVLIKAYQFNMELWEWRNYL